jgi:hypothetical protein
MKHFCAIHFPQEVTVLTLLYFFSSEHLPAATRERVISTFPHYGHGGIVEASRELFMQLNDCTRGLFFSNPMFIIWFSPAIKFYLKYFHSPYSLWLLSAETLNKCCKFQCFVLH